MNFIYSTVFCLLVLFCPDHVVMFLRELPYISPHSLKVKILLLNYFLNFHPINHPIILLFSSTNLLIFLIAFYLKILKKIVHMSYMDLRPSNFIINCFLLFLIVTLPYISIGYKLYLTLYYVCLYCIFYLYTFIIK
jgi:hypothetical protein